MRDVSLHRLTVLIRGAGEMATGVAHRLHRSGFRVAMTEIHRPLAVRRAVSFCEAVYDGEKTVEGVTARLIADPDRAGSVWAAGQIPLMVDPGAECRLTLAPQVMVDALLAKRNTGLHRDMAPLTIGLGPGFAAPNTVHLAVETQRGHNLGRLVYSGQPADNTGIPGTMGGYTTERVLRAPADGVMEPRRRIGDPVRAGQTVGSVAGKPMPAPIHGILRGLIRAGTPVTLGLKVGDIDPRAEAAYVHTISEKARAIGGSVLEAIMARFNRAEENTP